jgi:murein DD-endopeptidase MepM/ murein hydrolase activator NlpD
MGRRSPLWLYTVFAVLFATNVATGLALVFAPELNALFRQDNSHLIAAYEQRLTELRLEVDRLHSRQYAQAGDLNLQLHELVQQQDILSEQHEYVRALAEQARTLGIDTANDDTAGPRTTSALPAARTGGSDDVAAIADSVYAMQEETRRALIAISDAATLSANEIASELNGIGIHPSAPEQGVGGPFHPAEGLSEMSIVDEANAVSAALTRFQSVRDALQTAPIQTPIAGRAQMSSNFGNRTDPFLKRPAFHAGIDFRAPTGTPILAAADGTVSFSGSNGGYGKMVDIDHGNGLVTRYAHLSAIGVARGAKVSGGAQLGLAGSTGRSTGPHLHFEVRRNNQPVNPAGFISAGQRLARFF